MPSPLPDDHVIRWGIMGAGGIAAQIADDLRLVPGNTIAAVAAATPGKAAAFAARYGVAAWHEGPDSYAALARRPDVDVVYVATTHERHHANALAALNAGKAVLCEKPLTLHAGQARDLVAAAVRADVFLMEAMWTRFFPITQAVLDALPAIGGVRHIQADFGIRHPGGNDHRMFNPALAGGALLDLGIYPITYAMLLAGGAPTTVHGIPRWTSTGVDAGSVCVLDFPGGIQAQVSSCLDLVVPHQARIHGPLGRIVVDDFFHPSACTISLRGSDDRRIASAFPGHGYQFELAEVARCLRAGERSSPRRTWAETVAVLEVLDRLRGDWGLRYPGE
jgi:predicted dehydrogenase